MQHIFHLILFTCLPRQHHPKVDFFFDPDEIAVLYDYKEEIGACRVRRRSRGHVSAETHGSNMYSMCQRQLQYDEQSLCAKSQEEGPILHFYIHS